MRLTGAALLTAAGLLAGMAAAGALRARAEEWAELCRMLTLMEFELERFCTPMPELFERLGEQTQGKTRSFCLKMREGLDSLGEREFSEIWAQQAQIFLPAERELLLPLGHVLGRYGAAEQTRAVAACRENAKCARNEAAEAVREKGRLWTGLAAAGGAALAVLLL